MYGLGVKLFPFCCVVCQTHMGKKRNRDKAQVKDTDMATGESKSVNEISRDVDVLAVFLPCTPVKSPPGEKRESTNEH